MNKKEFKVKVTKAENEAIKALNYQKLALTTELGRVQQDISALWKAVGRKYDFDSKKKRVAWNPDDSTIRELGYEEIFGKEK